MEKAWEDFYCDEVLSGKTKVEIVMETEHSLAFYHTRPYYDVHIIVIPKKHILSLITMTDDDAEIIQDVLFVIKKLASQLNEKYGACKISTNIGDYQSNKHMHWHIHFGNRLRDEHGRILHDNQAK
jgi:histidine triad (HIT) family protein